MITNRYLRNFTGNDRDFVFEVFVIVDGRPTGYCVDNITLSTGRVRGVDVRITDIIETYDKAIKNEREWSFRKENYEYLLPWEYFE